MRKSFIALVAALLANGLTVSASSAQDALIDGWWIVMASFDENAANITDSEERVRNAAARCGVQAFNDFSAKFIGFRPGLVVVTSWNAYGSKAAANAALAQIRPCIPDAYIKKGRYVGE